LVVDSDAPTIFQVVDPHDVKPWAMIWAAVYRDGRIVVFDEWPDEHQLPYHETDQFRLGLTEYVELIRRKEERLRVYSRTMDATYGFKHVITGRGAVTIAGEMARLSGGEMRFVPSRGDPANQRHLVESAIRPRAVVGQDGVFEPEPRLFVSRRCKNLLYAIRRYMWKKNRGRTLENKNRLQPTPQEKFKCFPNCLEYLLGANPRWIHPEEWLWEPDDDPENEVAVIKGGHVTTGYNY